MLLPEKTVFVFEPCYVVELKDFDGYFTMLAAYIDKKIKAGN
jgi:hypothetical protein